MQKSHQVWVLGASGYSGAALCRILARHPSVNIAGAFSSAGSSPTELSKLYPELSGQLDLMVQPWCDSLIDEAASAVDSVFLALPHEASAFLAPLLLQQGCRVYDLSGAFRLDNVNNYPLYYGFEHTHPELLAVANYALPELNKSSAAYDAPLQSLPGCYPTAATLALAPLLQSGLCDSAQMPVVTAVSGVSGAGRKASMTTSFCEVSLQPYAVLTHRHQIELEQNLNCELIFVPQLGNFKRGIVATAVVTLQTDADGNVPDKAVVEALYQQAYGHQPAIRLRDQPAKIDDVAHTPFCDLYVQVVGRKVVVIAALDNLLKGAASQAVQVFNLSNGFDSMEALL